MEFQNEHLQIKNENDKKFSMNTFREYEKKVNVNTIKVIAISISLIGAVAGIILGNTEKVHEYYDEFFNVGIMFLTWLISDIIAVFLYTAALILEQLVKTNEMLKIGNRTGIITENTQSTDDEDFDNNTAWKCSKCGKINTNYVGTCGCGQLKNDN